VNARELGLQTASDSSILDAALAEGRIIVTLESDFHTMLAIRGLAAPSTILIRLHAPTAPQACTIIHSLCERFEHEIVAGSMVTVDSDSVRVRRLPVQFLW
jgi:predicted nuclease of predicted toxin-antitoxin system